MPTVIETLNDYHTYLVFDRELKSNTIRRINLSLRHFCELYGASETYSLQKADMQIFHDYMKSRKKDRINYYGERTNIEAVSIKKTMSTIKTYIKRLHDKGFTKNLTAVDVPTGDYVRPYPKYISKEELATIFQWLEDNLNKAKSKKTPQLIYSAYMRRALVWFLYTTGLRNAEIRGLTFDNIDIQLMTGSLIGKGDKL